MQRSLTRISATTLPFAECIAGLLLLALGVAGSAGATTAPQLTTTVRVKFLQAEAAAKANDDASFLRLRADLAAARYPLIDYLDAKRFGYRVDQVDREVFIELRSRLEHSPRLRRLEYLWLRQLAVTQQWAAFLRDFSGQSAADLRCSHARALFETGQRKAALGAARELWLTGRSQDRACDPVFARWQRQGMSRDLVLQRLELAIERSNTNLVRYLRTLLGPNHFPYIDAWMSVRKNPQSALALGTTEFVGRPAVMAHAVRRLVYRDPDGAAQLWRGLDALGARPGQDAAGRLASVMFRRQRHVEARDWGDFVEAKNSSERLRAVAIFSRIALGQWAQAFELLQLLSDAERSQEQWRYWQAQVSKHLGNDDGATETLADLAQERSYYGFLAADELGLPYQFGERPIEDGPDQQIRQSKGFERARELRSLGRVRAGRREWAALSRRADLDPRRVAHVASEEGWPSAALFALAKAKDFDALNVRFPLVHTALVKRFTRAQKLDLAWMMAMIRQESAFIEDVRSHAGAVGLMQLMPATGKQVAKQLGVSGFRTQKLRDPTLNVRLGTAYVRELLDKFEHPLLTTAGYNAGPHRIRRWLPTSRPMDATLWVETIPFEETRNYVKRIAYYRIIYARRLGIEIPKMRSFFNPVGPNPRSSKG
ncbi:MAG: soluble lytic murein transglycosylase [Gammaproteobacteria bacterium]|jgi:soluble lytic murein transglycosylase